MRVFHYVRSPYIHEPDFLTEDDTTAEMCRLEGCEVGQVDLDDEENACYSNLPVK